MLLTSVTASSVERANSSLRLLHSYLHTTMREERFIALIIYSCTETFKIDIEEVIKHFYKA